jgi:anti-sigma B factor antagonist
MFRVDATFSRQAAPAGMSEARDARYQRTTPLGIQIRDEGASSARLILEGELDLSGCDELNREISKLEARHLERFVVDLSELQFIDSTGIACLMHLAQRAQETPTELRFVRGPRELERILEIAGVSDLLPFERQR